MAPRTLNDDDKNKLRLVEGGQGRSGDDVSASAFAIGTVIFVALALWVIVWLVLRVIGGTS